MRSSRILRAFLVMAAKAALTVPCGASGQSLALVASDVRTLPSEDPGLPLVEPQLAVSPIDPDHLIAGVIAYDSATSIWEGSRIDVFHTRDGGRSWDQQRFEMEAGADPWMSIDAAGTAYVAYLSQTRGESGVRLWYRTSVRTGGRPI